MSGTHQLWPLVNPAVQPTWAALAVQTELALDAQQRVLGAMQQATDAWFEHRRQGLQAFAVLLRSMAEATSPLDVAEAQHQFFAGACDRALADLVTSHAHLPGSPEPAA